MRDRESGRGGIRLYQGDGMSCYLTPNRKKRSVYWLVGHIAKAKRRTEKEQNAVHLAQTGQFCMQTNI